MDVNSPTRRVDGLPPPAEYPEQRGWQNNWVNYPRFGDPNIIVVEARDVWTNSTNVWPRSHLGVMADEKSQSLDSYG